MHHRQGVSRKIHYVLEEYMNARGLHDVAEVDIDEFVTWARETHKLVLQLPDEHQLMRRQVTRALRDTFFVDRQKRLVRRYHHVIVENPVTNEKFDRVVDITTAPPGQMRLSLGVRREGIYNDVYQLATDLISYNDNNQFGATLQMDFNFNLDLEERGLPGEYPAEPPDYDDDDKN
jgi:hypothetical protein